MIFFIGEKTYRISLLEIKDMRELCRHSQLELSRSDIEANLPNIFSHCEVRRSERQYYSGWIGWIGLCEGSSKQQRDTDRGVKAKDG